MGRAAVLVYAYRPDITSSLAFVPGNRVPIWVIYYMTTFSLREKVKRWAKKLTAQNTGKCPQIGEKRRNKNESGKQENGIWEIGKYLQRREQGVWLGEDGHLWCDFSETPGERIPSGGLWNIQIFLFLSFSSAQFSHSVVSDSLWPMNRSTPGLPVHHQLPEFTQTHVHWVSDAIQPSHPLSVLLLLLPQIPPSIRVFSNESALSIRWPKYWSFGLSISPSNEHPGLISFRMDGLDLLAVQGTLKSLLQHHSSKASILRCSAVFIVQLSHPYMTTGKTIALTMQTFVSKITPLLFNMLSRWVIAFLTISKRLLISWLHSPSAVILELKKNSLSLFPLFPHLFAMKWWDGCHDLSFLNVEF